MLWFVFGVVCFDVLWKVGVNYVMICCLVNFLHVFKCIVVIFFVDKCCCESQSSVLQMCYMKCQPFHICIKNCMRRHTK